MADLSDVRDALKAVAVAAVYPNGVGVAPEPSVAVQIYAGWPDAKQLDEHLDANPPVAHLTIFNQAAGRDVTRYPLDEEDIYPDANTYTALVSGQTVTISGAAPNPLRPQNVAIGIEVTPYVFTAAAGETPAQIAAGLAALIQADIPGASVLGAVVTIPTPYRIKFARVGGVGEARTEVARQEKRFQVTIWAPSDAVRSEIGKLITPAFGATIRLNLPDGERAFLKCETYTDFDRGERERAFRRDLVYSVEFATTAKVAAPVIVAVPATIEQPEGTVIAQVLG